MQQDPSTDIKTEEQLILKEAEERGHTKHQAKATMERKTVKDRNINLMNVNI
jgi:hypothetical protein